MRWDHAYEEELGVINILHPQGQGEEQDRLLVCLSGHADPWAGVHIAGELSSRGGLKPLES